MALEIVLNKIIEEVLPMLGSASNEDDLLGKFSSSLSTLFGISSVNAIGTYKSKVQGSLFEYVLNTKKVYVDNQLSEYSAFPELIEYRNRGYKSCSVLPVVSNGKVVTLLEMLSEQENKFTEDLVNSIAFASYLFGFALMYKLESSRNVKLAGYFDAAFNSPLPQMLVSKDGSIIKFNKPAIKQFGVSQGANLNALGISIDKVIQSAKQHVPFAASLKSSQGQAIYSFYSENVSDSTFYLLASDRTSKDTLSSIALAASGTDRVCMLMLDSSFSIEEILGNAEHMFNYPGEMLYGKSFLELLDQRDRESFEKSAKALGPTASTERIVDLPLGKFGSMHVHIALSKMPLGYAVLLASDNAEKYVKDISSMLEDFISLSQDLILSVDQFGYIKGSNMSVESVLGYKKEELTGKDVKSMYIESEVLDRDIAYVRNGGKVDGSYVTLRKKSGELIPAIHSLRLMRGSSESDLSYLFVIHELQTKRTLSDQESKLKSQESEIKRLRMVSDLKSQFIYNISHELKTPLTAIKGFAKLLYGGEFGALTDEQKGYLNTILDESDRLLLIIQQVLDASKLEANKVKLDLKEVDFKVMRNNPSINALEESAKGKGLSFSWTVDYDVPTIIADPNRLIQVFVNLIGNSIKFTEKGGIDVHIIRKSRKRVECKVSDTGIGISDDDKRKIFKKFYQAPKKDLVKQDGAGTGLGLSITKDIISLHGGKITFESQQGKGTTFSFILPIRPREKKKEKQQPQQVESPAPAKPSA
ncbi:MAG: ATP-binding protein [Candidatus Micrarchaeia archaeon]